MHMTIEPWEGRETCQNGEDRGEPRPGTAGRTPRIYGFALCIVVSLLLWTGLALLSHVF